MDWLGRVSGSPARRRRAEEGASTAAPGCRRCLAALAAAALTGLGHGGGLQAQTGDYTVLSVPGVYTLGEALDKAEELLSQPSPVPVAIEISTGVYYLAQTVQLGPAFSGGEATPFVVRAAEDAAVVISGGERLDLSWETHGAGPIRKARVSGSTPVDQLFLNGEPQVRARYPNRDDSRPPDPRYPFGGFAGDALKPSRIARKGWANPVGGFVHSLHGARWGSLHYRITAFDPATNEVTREGGWQHNRPLYGEHGTYRFVENVFEELDAPGEWFHDPGEGYLYYYPEAGFDLACAVVEVPRLETLVRISGASASEPAQHIQIDGIEFTHTLHTFMKTRERLALSDWAIYRGGAVVIENARNVTISNNDFHSLGGNAVMVSNHARNVTVSGNEIRHIGAGGVNILGDGNALRNPRFSYSDRHAPRSSIDQTPGPVGDAYPARVTVHDNLIHHIGQVEKQVAGVQVYNASEVTISHNTIYRVPRAGINVSSGAWGGHVIEHNDVFHTVQETHDHGAFNSWGRDRYWNSGYATVPSGYKDGKSLALLDAVQATTIRNNRFMCVHGWDIDLDDGSSNYVIRNNVALHGGIKLREGFVRDVQSNVVSHIHPGYWFRDSEDRIQSNIILSRYWPFGPYSVWTQDGDRIDRNFFRREHLLEFVRSRFGSVDSRSEAGDPLFVDPAAGDFRVRPGSPALGVGFENFPMDRFGVRSRRLKARAEAAPIPAH